MWYGMQGMVLNEARLEDAENLEGVTRMCNGCRHGAKRRCTERFCPPPPGMHCIRARPSRLCRGRRGSAHAKLGYRVKSISSLVPSPMPALTAVIGAQPTPARLADGQVLTTSHQCPCKHHSVKAWLAPEDCIDMLRTLAYNEHNDLL